MQTKMFSIHKTFEPDSDGKRSITWYIYDGIVPSRLNSKHALEFIESIEPGTTLRFTAVNALDAQLRDLQARGANVVYTHWHTVGISKGLSAEEIVKAYFHADASLFRAFVPRQDIAELRALLANRNAIVGFAGDALRVIRQGGRNIGVMDIDEDERYAEAAMYVDKIAASFKVKNAKGKQVSYDTRINEMAATIHECRLFNEVVGFQSYITAASIVAASGGFERFSRVSSVWHYFGQHNIDGRAARRKKGQPMSWSPNGRTALYMMMQSIIKNKKNKWNAELHRIQDAELAVHAVKHPDCKTPKGHTLAMAMRKVQKEILKQFFLALKGEAYVNGQSSLEAQQQNAAASAASA
jgi:Transposase IS116/IS110/IS902 family